MQEMIHTSKGSKEVAKDTLFEKQNPLSKALFNINSSGMYGFYTSKDTGYVVMLSAIHESHVPSLETITEKVKEDWYEAQAHKKCV